MRVEATRLQWFGFLLQLEAVVLLLVLFAWWVVR